MSAVTAADTSVLVFRVGLGVVFLAHGYHHVFGGGKIAGTASWFEASACVLACCMRGPRASPNSAPEPC